METRKYWVEGMDCADCALKVDKGVRQLEGVEKINLNFATATLLVEGTVSEDTLFNRVEALGYRLIPAPEGPRRRPAEAFLPGLARFIVNRTETRVALAG